MKSIIKELTATASGRLTTGAALELFDRLEPAEIDSMTGRWRGSEVPTDNPLDGLLETLDWYGKEFVSPDIVHPLLFSDGNDRVVKVAAPSFLNLIVDLPGFKDGSFKSWLSDLKPVLIFINTNVMRTEKSQARLKMVEYRGRITAAMIYDHLPIVDYFKKIDERTVLGLMDWKNLSSPFFFLLEKV